MTALQTTSSVRCPDAAALAQVLVGHLVGHGATVSTASHNEWRLTCREGTAQFVARSNVLNITAYAHDAEQLAEVQYLLTSHVGEFNVETPAEILWNGDGDAVSTLPNLRKIKVEAVRDLSPRIRRITFSTPNLRRFDTLDALHVKLLLPRKDTNLYFPNLNAFGTVEWGEPHERAVIRKYTIRDIRPEQNVFDIYFVIHAHGGPGSRFAVNASIGDVIGMMGPGGGSARPSQWNLLVGDETALPAISRLISALPRDARGVAVIEIDSDEDRQELAAPSAMDIRWISRKSGTAWLINDIEAIDAPMQGSVFAWAGTEFDLFRKIRSSWRSGGRFTKADQLAVSYWRHGYAQS
ncbi:siderophore-interacting protein [Agrobacterium sp. AGB01]|uniref:DUF2218 domain-containing protein n=1 Tax=Agrobacterium sp. AGB01 TaxID=2769302 RepID=UPI00177EF4BB|nr:siderophore-interacting protein [Agrobacterium sp. AGB01]